MSRNGHWAPAACCDDFEHSEGHFGKLIVEEGPLGTGPFGTTFGQKPGNWCLKTVGEARYSRQLNLPRFSQNRAPAEVGAPFSRVRHSENRPETDSKRQRREKTRKIGSGVVSGRTFSAAGPFFGQFWGSSRAPETPKTVTFMPMVGPRSVTFRRPRSKCLPKALRTQKTSQNN